jgi:hypothetical protein
MTCEKVVLWTNLLIVIIPLSFFQVNIGKNGPLRTDAFPDSPRIETHKFET